MGVLEDVPERELDSEGDTDTLCDGEDDTDELAHRLQPYVSTQRPP